ncbi:capsule biosynthesis GfcC family protein [Celerinatantimonas yamalensis]|uniref:Capsule biosynthesis GfcC family protein n=1 Tax=Celerinatantimonas yamalensis TaxID=559956 RepID=A0ABW9G4T1_9GAMM
MRMDIQRLIIAALFALAFPAMAGDLSLDVSTQGQFVAPKMYHVIPKTRIAVLANSWQLKPDAYRLGIGLLRAQNKRDQSRLRWALLYQLKAMDINSDTRISLHQQVLKFAATGRVLQPFTWDIIDLKPEENRLLREGDIFVAPLRPDYVQVGGAAKQAKLAFVGHKTIADYMASITRLPGSDPSYVWVITPDTRIRKIGISYWNTQTAYLAPGSVLYVPLHGDKRFNQSMAQLYAAQILPY